MFSSPAKHEIDHRTIKLIVGMIALTLPFLTSALSAEPITSISASYHQDDSARNVFVGFLFAIAAFLLAYNGESRKEMLLSKIAAFAALGVALFPCGCDSGKEPVPYVHYVCAGVMFAILAVFCAIFYGRATRKGHPEAIWRSRIYFACGAAITASIAIILVDSVTHDALSGLAGKRLTYYCEGAGLIAFGISWLIASRVLPLFSSRAERFMPFN